MYIRRSCKDNQGVCSFPSAHIELTKRQQLLMFGQPYKIQLDLEMPESPRNKELGKYDYITLFFFKQLHTFSYGSRYNF